MEETWFDRLAVAVGRDKRSMRKISMDANCGPNYLQQMMKDRKEPGVEHFLRIVNTLGTASALYVMTGADFTQDDEEFLRLALALRPPLREKALDFFRLLQDRAGS